MGQLVIHGNVKFNAPIPSGTGDNVLTADPSTGELGQIGTIDTSTFIPNTLLDGRVFVGNASNVPTGVAVTGDVLISNTGVTSIGSGVIVNADVNASAAIALTKLATTTASRALVSDASGFIVVSTTTAAQIGFLSTLSSNVQDQLDSKINNSVMTSNGDIIYRAAGVPTRLPIGSAGEVLTVSGGGIPSWQAATPVPGGGTTGQYLAKNSNTNGDVGWYTLTLSRVTDVTATAAEVNILSGAVITTGELNHLSGVSSNIQTQFGGKQNTITGAASTATTSNFTANRAVISNGSGKLDVSTASDAELAHLVGVTSPIQAQINSKQGIGLPQHAIWVGNAANVAAPVAGGTTGQVLTINISGVPTWTTPGSGGTVTSIDVSGGTTGLTFSGGPITTSGTITMAGTLDETNGGTNQTSYTTGDILYASASNTLSKLPIGASGRVLTVTAGIPSWEPASGGVSDGDKGDITVSGGGATWTIDNQAVTYAKIQNVTTDRLLGRDTAGSGVVEELTVGGGVEFTGTGIQTSAFTGDVTKTAGGTTTTIANNAVTDGKFRQSAALSVVGNSTNSSANVADISASTDHQVLRRSGTSIGFGSIDLSQSGAVGSSILGIANGGTGSTGGAWLLSSGGTLTGVNTITSNAPNQLNFNGTWTATANNQYANNITGSVTSLGTSSTLIHTLFNPLLVQAGNITSINLIGLDVAPTWTTQTSRANTVALRITATGTFASTNYGIQIRESVFNNNLFRVRQDSFIEIGNAGASMFASADGSNPNSGAGILVLRGGGANQAATIGGLNLQTGSYSGTAAAATSIAINGVGLASGTGSTTYRTLSITPTFNTTASYSGIGYGIDYNPTLTNTTGLTHIAFRTTSGSILLGHTTLGANTTRLQVRNINDTTGKALYIDNTAGNETFGIDGYGGMTLNTATGGINKWNYNALGVTQVNGAGIWLANTTAAANGAQQISPSLVLEGQGWKTDATAASQSVKWAIDILPVQGAANPNASLRFSQSINNAAYTANVTINSAGTNALPTLVVNGGSSSASTIFSAIRAGNAAFGVRGDAAVLFGGGGAVIYPGGGAAVVDASSNSLWVANGNWNTGFVIGLRGGTNFTSTLGSANFLLISNTSFAPTAGNATLVGVNVGYTINTTGTYSGVGIGYNYDPTVTSTTGFTNIAFRATSGSLLMFANTKTANTGDRVLIMGNAATNATAAQTDGIVLQSRDSSDALATLAMYLEQAPEASASFTQSHRLKIWINGTEYWIALDAV